VSKNICLTSRSISVFIALSFITTGVVRTPAMASAPITSPVDRVAISRTIEPTTIRLTVTPSLAQFQAGLVTAALGGYVPHAQVRVLFTLTGPIISTVPFATCLPAHSVCSIVWAEHNAGAATIAASVQTGNGPAARVLAKTVLTVQIRSSHETTTVLWNGARTARLTRLSAQATPIVRLRGVRALPVRIGGLRTTLQRSCASGRPL